MALYDDSLETSVTSAKLHNSPYKVDFMRKLVTFSAGTFLLRKKFHDKTLKLVKKSLCLSPLSNATLENRDFSRLTAGLKDLRKT